MAFLHILATFILLQQAVDSYTIKTTISQYAIDFTIDLKLKSAKDDLKACKKLRTSNKMTCSINIPGLSSRSIEHIAVKAFRKQDALVYIYEYKDKDPSYIYNNKTDNRKQREMGREQIGGAVWKMVALDADESFCPERVPWHRMINRRNNHLNHKYEENLNKPKMVGSWKYQRIEAYCAPKWGACGGANRRLYMKEYRFGGTRSKNFYHRYTADHPNPKKVRKNIGKPTNCFVWTLR